MTNAGLSLNAELFKMPSNHRDIDTLYLIKLNCSWSWPPLKDAWTPLVIFLRDPESRLDDDPAKIPLFFRKVQFPPQTWRMTDSGQWCSLGRHDILIANDAAPPRDNWQRSMNVAHLRFVEPIFNGAAVHYHYHLARLVTDEDWAIQLKYKPPNFLAENEAFIYTAARKSETGTTGYQVGYLAIVKWNRWTRRGLTCGVWPFVSRRGVAGADERTMQRLLGVDRDQPYPRTTPVVPEFGGQVADSVVMALRITVGRVPESYGPGRRCFAITLAEENLAEREGKAGEDVFPVVAKKGEEFNPYRYQQKDPASDSDDAEDPDWSDASEDNLDKQGTGNRGKTPATAGP